MESINFTAPSLDLSGRTAVVTGSTRGIGLAVAAALAAAGAAVVLTSRSAADCAEVQAAFADAGFRALGIPTDASDLAATERMLGMAADKLGSLDILVNNAGVGGTEKPILDTTEEEWDATIRIDLKGVYFTSKLAAGLMKESKRGGRIINLASTAGIIPAKYTSCYAAAKAGVIHLTKVMANEWARWGINVNCVAPGYIVTSLTKSVMADEKNAAAVLKKIAQRRYGQPSDVASAILFLASDASAYITGAMLPVDGGMLLN